jgi:hypothetical protein
MDRQRFTQCFNRLAVALRLPAEEGDAAMKQVYWDALAGLPIEAIEDAARKFTASAEWFPKTSEWLSVGEQARSTRALTALLPEPREDAWRDECEACGDTGWETLACEGDRACGRPKVHGQHKYVVHCSCRLTNRTWQRKVEELRHSARGTE